MIVEVIMNTGQWIIIGLCAFLFVWYLGWNIFNRRRGIAVYYWLRKFLGRIGEISQAGWLGSSSSGARLGVAHGRKPFRQVEATYFLESRELIPLWMIHYLRGRQEVVQIRASLQLAPKCLLEVGRISDKRFGIQMEQKEYVIQNAPLAERYCVAWPSSETPPDTKALEEFLGGYRDVMYRLTLRRESPHLVIEAWIKPLLATSPENFFEALQVFLSSFVKT
jgi:hypothetical protein